MFQAQRQQDADLVIGGDVPPVGIVSLGEEGSPAPALILLPGVAQRALLGSPPAEAEHRDGDLGLAPEALEPGVAGDAAAGLLVLHLYVTRDSVQQLLLRGVHVEGLAQVSEEFGLWLPGDVVGGPNLAGDVFVLPHLEGEVSVDVKTFRQTFTVY